MPLRVTGCVVACISATNAIEACIRYPVMKTGSAVSSEDLQTAEVEKDG